MKRFVCMLALSSLLLLVGCGDKELKEEVNQLRQENKALFAEIEKLETELENASTITETNISNSLQVLDSTLSKEFKLIEDKLVFPQKIQLPDGIAVNDSNNSMVRVGSKFIYFPMDSWVVSLKGSELNLAHPSGIWGSIKSVTLRDTINEEMIKGVFKNFVKGFPDTNLQYSDIYINSSRSGMLARAPITIESEPYILTMGILVYDWQGQFYLFVSKNDNSTLQSEIVNSLLRSGMYENHNIKFD